ncbi:MAG: carboxypeptidase regulatory-like domain-containing protein [Candidatus Acidiferrales bacterium]
MSAERQETGTAAELTAPKIGSHPASARAATQTAEAAAPSVPISTKAEAGPAPRPNAQADLNSNAIQDLPLRGRNVADLQPLATSPAAPAATPRDNLEVEQNLPALRVQRPSVPDEKLSAVSGRVTDVSGAVIPGATVGLREASGGMWQVATGADGTFQFTGIPDGHYDLTVTAPGFRSNRQTLDLKPSEVATLQPILSLGAVTQTVEVTASAPVLETSASVAFVPAELPSRSPVSSSVSLGKRMFSLDRTGSLFLSRNAGKSWKKVHPQWTGKAIRLDLVAAASGEAKDKGEASGAEGARSVFQLTTDSGAQWTSKDGTHWRRQ